MNDLLRDHFNDVGLRSFISNALRSTPTEVKSDIKLEFNYAARLKELKETRDLFKLPKERDNECTRQLPRWPNECQVLDERMHHIDYTPAKPEPFYKATGRELQPRTIGEENGVIVYNYMPISASHYRKLNKRRDQVRTYGRNEDHIHMLKVENDFEFWGDFANDEILQRNLIAGREMQRFADDFYYYNYSRHTKEFNCQFCHDKIDPDYNRFSTFLEHNDIINHTNHFDNPSIPKKYADDAESANPCWCNNMPQFSRSSVGGSKYNQSPHPAELENDDLIFESRFESGNLARAVKVGTNHYELYLRPDLYTNRHTQWFYFSVKNTRSQTPYRFSIVNLTKPDSLYKEGMRPLMYSTAEADENDIGWQRCGQNIAYFRNDDNNIYSTKTDHTLMDDDDDEIVDNICSYTLTFEVEFEHDNDTVYFAHSYPYTFSDLQDYLMNIQEHPVKSKFCKLRLLCRTIAGNNVYYLTVTEPTSIEDEVSKRKKAIVITARVHPGESPSSWMMKGFMDFITGDSASAKKLRQNFIFKLVPMLNPDGVIVGNTRGSLSGRDLNRQYRTAIRETYPSIWNTKAMIKRLIEDCGVAFYCDFHAHSRKENIFIYGCENTKRHPDRRLLEQVFPLMLHKNAPDKFSFEDSKFKVQRNKEGCGRIVVWVLGVTNSFTLEASYMGSTLGARAGTHFSTMDYEQLGQAFGETLMDYFDVHPSKTNYIAAINKELWQYNSRFRPSYDETEAYLRHRERVREREKREKLKKQGKLSEYLRKLPDRKPEPRPKPEEKPRGPVVDDCLLKYQEAKKQWEESLSAERFIKFEVDDKKVEKIVTEIKKKKAMKKKWAELEKKELEEQMAEPEEFKPRMAGRTGLPTFFFSNIVQQHCTSFQRSENRNRRVLWRSAPKA